MVDFPQNRIDRIAHDSNNFLYCALIDDACNNAKAKHDYHENECPKQNVIITKPLKDVIPYQRSVESSQQFVFMNNVYEQRQAGNIVHESILEMNIIRDIYHTESHQNNKRVAVCIPS